VLSSNIPFGYRDIQTMIVSQVWTFGCSIHCLEEQSKESKQERSSNNSSSVVRRGVESWASSSVANLRSGAVEVGVNEGNIRSTNSSSSDNINELSVEVVEVQSGDGEFRVDGGHVGWSSVCIDCSISAVKNASLSKEGNEVIYQNILSSNVSNVVSSQRSIKVLSVWRVSSGVNVSKEGINNDGGHQVVVGQIQKISIIIAERFICWSLSNREGAQGKNDGN